MISPPIARYEGPGALADLLGRYWVPVWDFEDAGPQVQRTLQSPVPLLVISSTYARFYGVSTGLSRVELAGRGWAVGAMLRPAAGRALWRRPMTELTDTWVDVEALSAIDAAALRDEVRVLMNDAPADPAAHRRAMDALEKLLAALLPVDETGLLLNRAVDLVEQDLDLVTVRELADRLGLGERQLQRLVQDGLGLTPKWLLLRRRIHRAVLALKQPDAVLSRIAHDVGYTDQAHFTRDFRQVTGMTPGAYSRLQP